MDQVDVLPKEPESAVARARLSSRTFDRARLLAGFMERPAMEAFIEQARPAIDEHGISALWEKWDEARAFARALSIEPLDSVGFQKLAPAFAFREDEIRQTSEFQEVFADRAVLFGTVNPRRVVAFQTAIKIGRTVPTDPLDVLDECLPRRFAFDPDYDVSQQVGGQPVQVCVTSDVPNVHPGKVEVDRIGHAIRIPLIPNRNWLQIAHLEHRYWLRNGYHRVLAFLEADVTKIPAIVYEARDWDDVLNPNLGEPIYQALRSARRPPLVGDFLTAAAIEVPIRRRRAGLLVTIAFGEIQLPV